MKLLILITIDMSILFNSSWLRLSFLYIILQSYNTERLPFHYIL